MTTEAYLQMIVDSIQEIRDDIETIKSAVDIVHAAQVSHGKAIGDLEGKIDRFLWSHRRGSAPPLEVSK